jgi:hypothetical protein
MSECLKGSNELSWWHSSFLYYKQIVDVSFNHLQDLPPERAFADFVLCNLVLHLVIMNFLG